MRRQVIALGLMIAAFSALAEDERATKRDCVAVWEEIVSPMRKLTIQQQRDAWTEHKIKCEASGAYDYFSAKIDFQAGAFDGAREKAGKLTNVADQTLKVEAALLIADSYFMEFTRTGTPTDAHWKAIESSYQALIDHYPDSFAGYDGLAGVALARKDFNKTAHLATQANGKFPTARASRKLAISYAQLDKYPEAIAAGREALAMDPNLAAERDMMLAVALSQIEVGQLSAARKTLNVLLSYSPALKDDRGLINIVRYLRQHERNNVQDATN